MGLRLKVLSGKDVVKILSGFGFSVYGQKGSHIKLKRFLSNSTETLLVPNHDPISPGTLKAIFNQSIKYVPKSELLDHFFIK